LTGTLWLIVGPSGSGKTTLAQGLWRKICLREVVSVTTRPPRPGEVDGVHYRFIARAEYDQLLAAGELIEAVEYNGNGYGSTRGSVLAVLADDDACIVVDGRGAESFLQAFPENAKVLFVLPPGDEELRRRLEARGDSVAAIDWRMKSKAAELAFARKAGFTFRLIPAGPPDDMLSAALAAIRGAPPVLVLLEHRYAGRHGPKCDCSDCKADVTRNLRFARAAMRDCFLRGEAPFASAPLYAQPGVLDDRIAHERTSGIEGGLAWGQKASQTVLYTDLGISGGMQIGLERAKAEGRPVELRELGADWEAWAA
jgi:guanylate kinase